MTLGQVSEAVFILAIPFLFNSIGVKKMLLLGMIAWILSYICLLMEILTMAYGCSTQESSSTESATTSSS